MQDKGFNRLGIMLDCSRNGVMNITTMKKWIDILADLGYNTLMLYTEDTFEVENEPYFGYLRGRYSMSEIKEIDSYAENKGIELIPAIQTLAHLNALFHWENYNEIRDCNDIILANNERSYELIENIFSTLEKNYKTRTVNIGMDEAHMLGRGKYMDINGATDSFDILIKHLNKVADIARKHGFKCIMWGDMFFRLMGDGYSGSNENIKVPDRIKKLIPDNVDLVYWDYYSTDKENFKNRIKEHSAVKSGIWFAGGLWSWSGFAPHNDYSIDEVKASFEACREENIKNVFLTMWGDNGAECSKFSLLPSLYYASRVAVGEYDIDIIKKGFEDKFGIPFDSFMLLDLPANPEFKKNIIENPDKYMLYNDLFSGWLDSSVHSEPSMLYDKGARKLMCWTDNAQFGYLFNTMATLCSLLAVKYDLGVRTRDAYKNKDKAALIRLVKDYELMLSRIKDFYNALSLQWEKENKSHGFEVQDIRLGGLYFRTANCKDKLQQLIEGKIEIIDQLEDEILPIPKESHYYNNWSTTASVNII